MAFTSHSFGVVDNGRVHDFSETSPSSPTISYRDYIDRHPSILFSYPYAQFSLGILSGVDRRPPAEYDNWTARMLGVRNTMSDGQYVEGSIWFYAPNKGAAIFFSIAFFVTGAVHFWQAVYVSPGADDRHHNKATTMSQGPTNDLLQTLSQLAINRVICALLGSLRRWLHHEGPRGF